MNVKLIEAAQGSYRYPLLIKCILADSLKHEPQREIVYRDVFTMDYFGLNKRVRQLANLLGRLGMDGGKTIGIMDYDSHRYLESFFAIPMTGNVLHTVNWRLSQEQVAYTIGHADDELLIMHEDFLSIAQPICERLPLVTKVIITSDRPSFTLADIDHLLTAAMRAKVIGEYEALLSEETDQYTFPDFDENAVATIFYTTGTTGNPKGVYFTHRQLVLHTMACAALYGGALDSTFSGFNSSAVFMGLTPLFHVHGWGFPYYATMVNAKQVYLGKFTVEYFAEYFAKHGATFTSGVPSILQMILTSPLTEGLDFSKTKMLIGGSALSAKLGAEALARGIDVVAGYGMSESAPMLTVAYLNKQKAQTAASSGVEARITAGTPVYMVELAVTGPNGEPLAHDGHTVGEIVARAPWLTGGYYKEASAGEQLWAQGWMHTGDAGTIDEHCVVRVTDRIKDVIKTGGEWVSSIHLESIISKHPAVAEAAIVGLPDTKWGERPHAMIALREGHDANEEEIRAFLSKYVASKEITKWSVPDRVVFVSSLPKTSVGKIDKKLIRTMI
jgi:fatty-acyl-CoA synthase